ncbi:hypothetical protein EV426DRAFT_710860 [Tirmania nivea]|nr:hypothetical protein EV426DRAFT_710860 [Tirmania nivea]
MPTFSVSVLHGQTPAGSNRKTTITDGPLASVVSRAEEAILSQVMPLLPITPARVLRNIFQAAGAGAQQQGHQGQEDWAVAAEFDATYQCTVQNTGDHGAVPQPPQAAHVYRTLPAWVTLDAHRELSEAQIDDSRILGHRGRSGVEARHEIFTEPPDMDWQEVRTARDIPDNSEVYALDSQSDHASREADWSILRHTSGQVDDERESEELLFDSCEILETTAQPIRRLLRSASRADSISNNLFWKEFEIVVFQDMQRNFVSSLTAALREEAARVASAELNEQPTGPGRPNPTAESDMQNAKSRGQQPPRRRGQKPPRRHGYMHPQPPKQPLSNIEQLPYPNPPSQSNSTDPQSVSASQRAPTINRAPALRPAFDPIHGGAQVPTMGVSRASIATKSPNHPRQPISTIISQGSVTANTMDRSCDANNAAVLLLGPEAELIDSGSEDVFDGHCGPYLESEDLDWHSSSDEGNEDDGTGKEGLVNTVGKLAAKILAEDLQGIAELWHPLAFARGKEEAQWIALQLLAAGKDGGDPGGISRAAGLVNALLQPRQFEMEVDGKITGRTSMTQGTLQGSTLSLSMMISKAEEKAEDSRRLGLRQREGHRGGTFLLLSYIDDVNSVWSGRERSLDIVLGEAAGEYGKEWDASKNWKGGWKGWVRSGTSGYAEVGEGVLDRNRDSRYPGTEYMDGDEEGRMGGISIRKRSTSMQKIAEEVLREVLEEEAGPR